MKSNKLKISLLSLGIFCLWCAAAASGFMEPTPDDSMLVIGRVIVEDNGFTEKRAVHKNNIKVGIMGKSVDGKESGRWTTTDENGYFALANVPKGEYALKAIQLSVGYGQFLTIDNRLNAANDAFLISQKSNILFNGRYFPFEAEDRILSLKHNVFTLDVANRRVMATRVLTATTLSDIKLYDSELLNDGPVEAYFIEKFPASAWRTALEASAQAN